MKKIFLFTLSALACLMAASCGKSCACYEPYGNTMTRTDVVVEDGIRCSSLTTPGRTCVEMSEADIIDQNGMAIDFKK